MARIIIPVEDKALSDKVRVVVPVQESGVKVFIEPLEPISGADQGNFKLIRPTLGNFQVLFEENGTNHPVEYFDPPMEITVCYDENEIDEVLTRGRPLKLGVYVKYKETEKGRWWILPVTEEVPCPHKEPHAGALKVIITGRWADPEVGWGT